MTAESILAWLRSECWSAAEYATDRGHVAEAAKGGRVVIMAAPTAAQAWALVWERVVAPRPVTGS